MLTLFDSSYIIIPLIQNIYSLHPQNQLRFTMKLLSAITIATAIACASGQPEEPPAACDVAAATLASYWCTSLPFYPPRCTSAEALEDKLCCKGILGCDGGGLQPGQRLLRKQNVA